MVIRPTKDTRRGQEELSSATSVATCGYVQRRPEGNEVPVEYSR